ncbi:uncharacterized protein TRIVIDRAFT_209595 [Trichoderma virens Gv29-8]|uniref:Uncharacterized protein n=1 Tax=Hypocrea virens (strain Gv29-8 / FGSC 10586) TaxID=413071 RepID=G9MXU4_HYPVG|nr:uncharacterized protein TRIVIDRAFT_209595 [Trichoderma virens Gv29-8]EHK20705.1 hypothetical protein TRIVIDRAFT_209595 [Trichoderma virens Gv29-8]UKZ56996.1 hypothetical protein TrVGV298_010846 [Trichoderma virens]
MADYYNLDKEDPSTALEFDLYQNLTHEATLASGSVKSYGVKEGGSAIFDKKKSRYSVSAQRLLWIDGWEKTTFESGEAVHHQEMTLVVLKIVFASYDTEKKFRSAKISLMLEDINGEETKGANEPRVEAWAPFNTPEKWNMSMSHHTESNKKEGSLQFEFSGAGLSTGLSNERETSWDQSAFDTAMSYSEFSTVTGNPNTVSWVLEQNRLEKSGILPNFLVAVLISRRSPEPYLVRFHINTRVGTVEDLRDKTKSFFGLNPERTRPFRVTPGEREVCSSEGADMRKYVDADNLGKLRDEEDCTKLDFKWGTKHQLEIKPQAIGKRMEGGLGSDATAEEGSDSWTDKVPSASFTAQAPKAGVAIVPPPQPTVLGTQLSLPPLMIGWSDMALTSPVDLGRVTALEVRIAQLEARLATQDAIIFQLQQALAIRDR